MHQTTKTAYRNRQRWFGNITAYPHARPRSWSLSPEAIPWRASPQLVVSENTIRTHSKRIYAKLDIHKKQELVDLLETFNPKDLED